MTLAPRADRKHDEVGARAVRDPQLLAGDDQVVAVLHRARLDRRNITAPAGFADSQRADPFAGDRAREKFGLLLLRAEFLDDGDGHIRLHQQRHVHTARIRVRERFDVSGCRPPVETRAAPLGVDPDSEQPEVTRFAEDLAREDSFFVPLGRVRRDFLFRKPLNGLPDHVVLVREWRKLSRRLRNGLRAHRCSPWNRSQPASGPARPPAPP